MRDPAFSSPYSCAPLEKAQGNLPIHGSLLTFVGTTQTGVRDQLSHHNPFRFAPLVLPHKGQYSLGSWMIEVSYDLAESGAYLPEKVGPGTLAHAMAPHQTFRGNATPSVACHPLPSSTKMELGRGARGVDIIFNLQPAAASPPTG